MMEKMDGREELPFQGMSDEWIGKVISGMDEHYGFIVWGCNMAGEDEYCARMVRQDPGEFAGMSENEAREVYRQACGKERKALEHGFGQIKVNGIYIEGRANIGNADGPIDVFSVKENLKDVFALFTGKEQGNMCILHIKDGQLRGFNRHNGLYDEFTIYALKEPVNFRSNVPARVPERESLVPVLDAYFRWGLVEEGKDGGTMTAEQKMYLAYKRNPVKGIEAEPFTHHGGGILLRSGAVEVMVFTDGHMEMAGQSSDQEEVLRLLHKNDGAVEELAVTMSNDFRIMALRENHTQSIIYTNDYDAGSVEEILAEWEKATGRIICLDDYFRNLLYKDVMKSTPYASEHDITEWLEGNGIPSMHTGHVTITVDRASRTLMMQGTIDRVDRETDVEQSVSYSLQENCDLNVCFGSIMKKICNLFGMDTRKLNLENFT